MTQRGMHLAVLWITNFGRIPIPDSDWEEGQEEFIHELCERARQGETIDASTIGHYSDLHDLHIETHLAEEWAYEDRIHRLGKRAFEVEMKKLPWSEPKVTWGGWTGPRPDQHLRDWQDSFEYDQLIRARNQRNWELHMEQALRELAEREHPHP